ncbi:hypothetical protein THTE_0684 [Thermogutta terrifontis]|uniref:Uncharacterized protein n=1 Tax=Thermogutta terrifontis TaxID=1331910 RepID=A0A286RBF3_9BACT|nr:hypothetical protein THTE_0684 [Thermogutta terrifontis]
MTSAIVPPYSDCLGLLLYQFPKIPNFCSESGSLPFQVCSSAARRIPPNFFLCDFQ